MLMPGNGSPQMMGSPSLSNQISSMGSPQMSEDQKPNPQQDSAADLVNRFGVIFQDLNNLASSFPAASTEFNLVKTALKNWLASASDGIATSGGESTTY